MELFQRLLQLREADAQIVQREREAYQAEADMLRRQVEEMQAAATRRPSPCQKPGVIADAQIPIRYKPSVDWKSRPYSVQALRDAILWNSDDLVSLEHSLGKVFYVF